MFENPHCGKSLVPLMKATTRCLATKSSRADLSSGVRPEGPPERAGGGGGGAGGKSKG